MQIDLNKLERILPTVRKPGRYVGGEYNSLVKNWDATPTRVCLAFPDIYDLGMSNLAGRTRLPAMGGYDRGDARGRYSALQPGEQTLSGRV